MGAPRTGVGATVEFSKRIAVIAGPGGDVLLPDVPRTWIYLLGTALLLVLAVALPLPRGARALAESRGLGHVEP